MQFLGTRGPEQMSEEISADPDAARCEWAVHNGGKDDRAQIMLFIEPDILIEFPESAPGQMVRWGVGAAGIRHLFISHSHGDHFSPQAIVDSFGGAEASVTVYGNTRTCEELLAHIDGRAADSRIQVVDLERRIGSRVQCADRLTVVPVRANHDLRFGPLVGNRNTVRIALNYILEAGEARVFYGCDSGLMLGETFDVVRRYRYDAVVLDMAFGFWSFESIGLYKTASGLWLPESAQPILLLIDGHQNLDMVSDTYDALRAESAVTDDTWCFVGHVRRREIGPHDEAQARLDSYGIALPYDGMVAELPRPTRRAC